jgi:type II secretory pathway pseudopilin PulG
MTGIQTFRRVNSAWGFSLLEMMASVAILTLVMGAVFMFLNQTQKRLQGSMVISESNQTARAAMEMISQEIGQAGFNPQFIDTKTDSTAITPSPTAQCVTLNNITGINPGNWVAVDSGPNYELVQVTATSNGALSGSTICSSTNQIRGIFLMNHTPAPTVPITSYKFPYPSGILRNATVSWGGTNVTVSNDHMLAFFGDINSDGNIYYVVYSLYNPDSGTPPQVTVNGQTYYLYTLYRSITQVTFSSGATNVKASPLVQNVLYQGVTASNPVGPTGQAIFGYPNTLSVAISPSIVSVVGTVVINLCVAVNPKALETSNTVQWYTMATQIRPVNLWSAVTVNVTGGSKYLPQTPAGLPMAFPSPLANYYF